MKEYRIDTFMPHNITYFDDRKKAVEYGEEQISKGKVAFLLKHVYDGKYDVVCEIGEEV